MATRKANANDVRIAEKRVRALQLRASGMTFQQIADALGDKSASGARQLILSALKEIQREPAQELIELSNRRLDAALMAIWPRVLRGDLLAIDRLIRIETRRARLLGLDAPTKREITGEWILKSAAEKAAEQYGLDPAEVIAQAEALVRELSS